MEPRKRFAGLRAKRQRFRDGRLCAVSVRVKKAGVQGRPAASKTMSDKHFVHLMKKKEKNRFALPNVPLMGAVERPREVIRTCVHSKQIGP